MLCVWSAKGGSGCSVVAASLALLAARDDDTTLLVDLAGEQPGVLGIEVSGPGVADWVAAPDPPPDALSRLEVPVRSGLTMLPLGATSTPLAASLAEPAGGDPGGDPGPVPGTDRSQLLARLLAGEQRPVVVDVGCGSLARDEVLDCARTTILVTRACYLSLTRASRQRCPDGIVVVREPGRALRSADIEEAIGAPVLVSVDWDPAVARAVDAGLLAKRLPRTLRSLRPVAHGANHG